MRLDVYLTSAGYCPSRTQAKGWIEGGFVSVNGKVIRKASFVIEDNASPEIALSGKPHPFVGRGGVKLEGALNAFGVNVSGKICADIGASTGGFTDCLLRRGAAKVFAVDSGSDQLDKSLREDGRVVNIERFNARNLTPETFATLCDIAVADLSFISQTYVLPNIRDILRPGGIYIGLIKPQFECGPHATDRRGIVKNKADHEAAVRRVRDSASACSLFMRELIVSPITGGDGNREFLCLCVHSDGKETCSVTDQLISKVVRS